MTRASYLLIAGVLSELAAAAPAPRAPVLRPRQDDTGDQVTFADIDPSPDIDWVDCYEENFQCTYLTVPLDYANTDAGTTDVAFIRYLISEDAEDLINNPGGPGESGIESLLGWGETQAKQWGYNQVSFDPRGVRWTKPKLSCSYTKDTKLRRRATDGLGNLTEVWDSSLEYNQDCSAANEDNDAKYVGSSAVAQDMMHFTKLQAAARGKDPEKALINYYGVSYGTLIGQTLVAMYPDRIRRVLLNGNVHGVGNYQGWEPSSLDDFAHCLWLFAKLCYEAGENWCPLAEGAKSLEDVQAQFDDAVKKLRKNPIESSDGEFDHESFLSKVQGFSYFPSDPEQGFAALANLTLSVLTDTADSKALTESDDSTDEDGDVLSIITAVDIAGRYPWSTYEQWKAAAESLQERAPYGAQLYATTNGMVGLGLKIIPPPSQFFHGFEKITPRVPVLFVNTAGDPVTPASAARGMSDLFVGSGVVVVEGPGHTYGSAPSKCANAIVADYLENGTVPKQEKRCETDVKANYYFGGPTPAWTEE